MCGCVCVCWFSAISCAGGGQRTTASSGHVPNLVAHPLSSSHTLDMPFLHNHHLGLGPLRRVREEQQPGRGEFSPQPFHNAARLQRRRKRSAAGGNQGPEGDL